MTVYSEYPTTGLVQQKRICNIHSKQQNQIVVTIWSEV